MTQLCSRRVNVSPTTGAVAIVVLATVASSIAFQAATMLMHWNRLSDVSTPVHHPQAQHTTDLQQPRITTTGPSKAAAYHLHPPLYFDCWQPHPLTASQSSALTAAATAISSSQIPPVSDSTAVRRVLVTGAAGFIGYHTAKALSQLPNTAVLGLDNFNPTLYDPSLKRKRQKLLSSCCNVSIVEGDIRDGSLMSGLFNCHRFTQVVHLAAQAGVRLSVQQPTSYISNNVEGTVVLLDAIRRQHPAASLVYASSSSVYGVPDSCNSNCTAGCRVTAEAPASRHSSTATTQGRANKTCRCRSQNGCTGNAGGCCCHICCGCSGGCCCTVLAQQHGLPATSSNCSSSNSSSNSNRSNSSNRAPLLQPPGMIRPSSEWAVACGQPTSVYAVSKIAMEKLVTVYTQQYGIKATGLRFFTVYGPYGRPDMAVWAWTQKLMAGQPISVPCFPVASAAQQQQMSACCMGGCGTGGGQSNGNGSGRQGKGGGKQQWSLDDVVTDAAGASLPQVPLPPNGCLPPFRDFTAVSDVVSGILAACMISDETAEGKSSRHNVYNLGRGHPVSVVQLLRQLQYLLGISAVRVAYHQVAAGSADVMSTWADITAARQKLGFRPAVDLQQGLQEFVAWYMREGMQATAVA